MKLFDPLEGLSTLSPALRRVLAELTRGGSAAPAPASGDLRSSAHSVQSELDGSSVMTHEEVSSTATNVLVQVALCMRHAHRVLQVLNSSLSRTLSCTVYVNMTALHALGASLGDTLHHSTPSAASSSSAPTEQISEEQLRVFVRKALWQMGRADCATPLGKSEGDEGQDEDDEEYQQSDDDSQQVFLQFSTILVFVLVLIFKQHCLSSFLPLN